VLGCMKSANDSLDISSTEGNAPTLTQWGVASNLPFVAISKASPVWNARQSLGIETLTSSPPRVRMYRPEVGEGLETICGWPFSPHRSSMALIKLSVLSAKKQVDYLLGKVLLVTNDQGGNHTSCRLARPRVNPETEGSSGAVGLLLYLRFESNQPAKALNL